MGTFQSTIGLVPTGVEGILVRCDATFQDDVLSSGMLLDGVRSS